ncbi:redoxin domain-containing protein [uncultured Winogradskyella sp.]|uniref:peroxiredoxin family protein n=1 Tax=uncultured Winogradskyella sp. TaxID=395353 RepID=UPI0030ED2D0B|tara:strand:+ start:357 stop:884 length:528 start_codon:yes stop_codon:yes gene_type:complete
MRKKKILILLIITIISVFSYLGYNIITKAKEKNKIAKQIKTIPQFELQTLDRIPFTNANLKPNTSIIFIYFNSECDFCQHEAKSISNNLNDFKNVQFIFVSTEDIAIIKQFSAEYELNNKPNITFLYDNSSHFANQFNAQSIPYILIYNQNNQLIRKQNGQLNANGILRVINQND